MPSGLLCCYEALASFLEACKVVNTSLAATCEVDEVHKRLRAGKRSQCKPSTEMPFRPALVGCSRRYLDVPLDDCLQAESLKSLHSVLQIIAASLHVKGY